ncbi:crossover junction endodeoxyribonuclease RuvC [Nesterenkonia pannonica]|uniref:crossover junction endodeoxyribonuclease RuvC n=1 Tax=Nesterenkonia pannonica TaxID=1548602 RepID=UPI00216404D6|nr:crossover junction endodeoxyribonuclease RuvC [Nesterenkonia pannonica]
MDPGLTRCGFAVIEMAPNRSGSSVHVQVTSTKPDEDLARRILSIQRAAEKLLDSFAPDVVAVERVFASSNAPTAMATAQAVGVIIAAAAARDIPVAWHTPSEVKAAVTDDGTAGKAAVARMVQRILRLPTLPTPVDATDAYAVAICHAWRSGVGPRTACRRAPGLIRERRPRCRRPQRRAAEPKPLPRRRGAPLRSELRAAEAARVLEGLF